MLFNYINLYLSLFQIINDAFKEELVLPAHDEEEVLKTIYNVGKIKML